jgi:serine/threonine-protein kinase
VGKSLPEESGGGHRLGRYLLYEAIARGGMATVHFGRLSGPVGFSRTVAIKRLHANFATDPEFVAMFLDEARLAARISHPNVVPTLDVVATGGEVFIVLEYVSGESLGKLWRAHVAKNERIPIPYSLAILANALHGLHAAHEVRDEQGQPLGIVHRDVSPQNIIVGTDGVARVLDFGVAKAAGRLQETGDSGALKGKIAYMAPEQITGGNVSRLTDVYAAAVVLWELLAGRRLIDGENDAQRAAKILGSVNAPVFEPPSRYNPEVSPALDELVLRGLAWPPSARFATAKEMAGHLERSGGLVSATEIGDWVGRLAGPALQERAGRLHAIEASTGRGKTYDMPSTSDLALGPGVARAGVTGAGIGVVDTEQTVAAAPPVFVEEPAPESRRRSRGLAVALVVMGMLALVGLVAGSLAWRGRSTAAATPSLAAAPRPAVAPGGTSEIAPGADGTITTGSTPSASASASASASSASASAPSSATPASSAGAGAKAAGGKTKGTPHTINTAARTTTPKPPDCDPPYVIDAENHKVYKRECLK